MDARAITAAVVALMNEKLEAMPLSVYRSQTQFMKAAAKLAGSSAGNMRALMTGETPSLRLDYLYALAAALGENPLELLAEAERRFEANPTQVPRPAAPSVRRKRLPNVRTGEQASRLSASVAAAGDGVQDKAAVKPGPSDVESAMGCPAPRDRPRAI